MTLGKALFPEFGNRTNDRDAGVRLDAAGQYRLMPLAGHAIQDHAADAHRRIKGGDAAHYRRHGAGGLGAVDAQDHR